MRKGFMIVSTMASTLMTVGLAYMSVLVMPKHQLRLNVIKAYFETVIQRQVLSLYQVSLTYENHLTDQIYTAHSPNFAKAISRSPPVSPSTQYPDRAVRRTSIRGQICAPRAGCTRAADEIRFSWGSLLSRHRASRSHEGHPSMSRNHTNSTDAIQLFCLNSSRVFRFLCGNGSIPELILDLVSLFCVTLQGWIDHFLSTYL